MGLTLRAGLLGFVLATTSCGSPPSDEQVSRLPAIDAAEAPPPATAAHRGSPLQRRRAYYADWGRCADRSGRRLQQSWARYQQDVDGQRVRVRTKGVQPFVDELGPQLSGCPLGDDVPPDVPPEVLTQGRAYVLAARSYGNRTRELAEYFDTQAYAEDDWALLQRVAPDFAQAHADASAAAESFAATLDQARDDADRAWLTALSEGDGETLPWHVTRTLLEARGTAGCVSEQRPLPPTCERALTSFSTARKALETYRDTHRAEAVGVFWLDVFRMKADALEAASTQLRAPPPRRRRGTPPPTPPEQHLQRARSELLAAGDRVSFDVP